MTDAAATRDWNALIREVVAGSWTDPETGKPAKVDFETIELATSFAGREAAVVAPLRLGRRLAVVADSNTVEVMGRRVAQALRDIATVDLTVLPGDLACDETTVERIRLLTRDADGVVAVGSGSLTDACKYATFQDGRPYAVFGTAASMNGYAASTASVTDRSGLKRSLPAHAPRGIFLDLQVCAAAPSWLSSAGLGDSLCRPTAQIDWWASHRLFGTYYSRVPYVLQEADEGPMLAAGRGIGSHDLTSIGILQRVLTLCGLGVCFTGMSHHGSMGEHQVSHWIDMFAGAAHPGSTHGQNVGVASLAMARLQHEILSLDRPPRLRPTTIDEAGMIRRYGPTLGALCIAESKKKALDAAATDRLNGRLAQLWPTLRRELQAFALPPERMRAALAAAGGPTTASELGLPLEVWRNAMRHAREIRNRWSFLDLAADSGLLEDFLQRDPQ